METLIDLFIQKISIIEPGAMISDLIKDSVKNIILLMFAILVSATAYVLKKSKEKFLFFRIYDYEASTDGLYKINRWSPNRLLTKDSHKVFVSHERPGFFWSSDPEWHQIQNDISKEMDGDICYLTDYSIDHREGLLSQIFSITVTPADYSEHWTTCRFLEKNPNIYNNFKDEINTDPKLYLSHACPSLLAINVVIISQDGFILGIRRSTSVADGKGLWTFGPYETMRYTKNYIPGSEVEDLFLLAERCLREECGLEPKHYNNNIVISWFGLYVPINGTMIRSHAVGLVKLSITRAKAQEYFHTAHSIQESESFVWLPFRRKQIENFLISDVPYEKKEPWIDQAKLALQEAWRMRSVL